jgi:hypothetical protein
LIVCNRTEPPQSLPHRSDRTGTRTRRTWGSSSALWTSRRTSSMPAHSRCWSVLGQSTELDYELHSSNNFLLGHKLRNLFLRSIIIKPHCLPNENTPIIYHMNTSMAVKYVKRFTIRKLTLFSWSSHKLTSLFLFLLNLVNKTIRRILIRKKGTYRNPWFMIQRLDYKIMI